MSVETTESMRAPRSSNATKEGKAVNPDNREDSDRTSKEEVKTNAILEALKDSVFEEAVTAKQFGASPRLQLAITAANAREMSKICGALERKTEAEYYASEANIASKCDKANSMLSFLSNVPVLERLAKSGVDARTRLVHQQTMLTGAMNATARNGEAIFQSLQTMLNTMNR